MKNDILEKLLQELDEKPDEKDVKLNLKIFLKQLLFHPNKQYQIFKEIWQKIFPESENEILGFNFPKSAYIKGMKDL